MSRKPRKALVCPVCRRTFTQARSNQKYCGKGCAKTADGVKQMVRLVNSSAKKIIEEVKDDNN
jgi:protein-arginine kinase activator protein McsA